MLSLEVGRSPGLLAAVNFGYVAFSILSGLVVFGLFWVAAVVVSRIVVRVATARKIDKALVRLFERVCRIGLILFGVVTGLGTAGINVGALVAGLGLTGFALGFALKDTISNLLAGTLIIIYKPFRRGDHIKVSSIEGTVTKIDLRYTVLEADDQRIFVPNSMLFTNAIAVDIPPPEDLAVTDEDIDAI